VTTEQSACPARELAPFCVFRTGRQDCGAPEGQSPYGEISDRKGLSSKQWLNINQFVILSPDMGFRTAPGPSVSSIR